MRILKTEFTRFFVLGFAAGAALVFSAVGFNSAGDIASGIVPQAEAAAAQ